MQAIIDTLWLLLNVGLTVCEVSMQEGGNPSTLLVKAGRWAASFTCRTRSGKFPSFRYLGYHSSDNLWS